MEHSIGPLLYLLPFPILDADERGVTYEPCYNLSLAATSVSTCKIQDLRGDQLQTGMCLRQLGTSPFFVVRFRAASAKTNNDGKKRSALLFLWFVFARGAKTNQRYNGKYQSDHRRQSSAVRGDRVTRVKSLM
jgi:hypothetical protein